MTNYMTLYINKLTNDMKEKAFKALESLGYKTILKDIKVDHKRTTSLWVAINGDFTIICESGCFSKYMDSKPVVFMKDEYNLIKESVQ